MSEVFLWPTALAGLLVVPIVWFGWWSRHRARARALRAIVGRRAPVLGRELSSSRRRWQRRLGVAGLTCALLAVAQPSWGEDVVVVEQRGVDLLVCLDVSRSMRARDLAPDRLEFARAAVVDLAEHARNDRLGLVAFAGGARLVSPLTRDTNSFLELLATVDELSAPVGGTDLGDALERAVEALAGSGEHAVVMLVTDGEDHRQRGLRAAALCAERRIPVHAVGVGSTAGSKVPVTGPGGATFLRDRSGADVVSAMRPSDLAAIAAATGGTFVDASRTDRPLATLYDERVLPMADRVLAADEDRRRSNRYQWPLSCALLLWLAQVALGDRRRAGAHDPLIVRGTT